MVGEVDLSKVTSGVVDLSAAASGEVVVPLDWPRKPDNNDSLRT